MKKAKKTLTKNEVKHITKLANLTLSEKEIRKFQKQLGDILNYINQLQKVNTEKVCPISQVAELENVYREDIVLPSLPKEKVLTNTHGVYKDYFKVKTVFG